MGSHELNLKKTRRQSYLFFVVQVLHQVIDTCYAISLIDTISEHSYRQILKLSETIASQDINLLSVASSSQQRYQIIKVLVQADTGVQVHR